jgi:hypothetical protein
VCVCLLVVRLTYTDNVDRKYRHMGYCQDIL